MSRPPVLWAEERASEARDDTQGDSSFVQCFALASGVDRDLDSGCPGFGIELRLEVPSYREQSDTGRAMDVDSVG